MMNTGPLVSVIIPAYNAAAFLAETLDSVLSQTYRNLEVLVVDDGSQDDTPRIVEAVAVRDSRVHLLRQQRRGVGVARNLAVARASGAYIAPIDADDIWFPSKIEKQVGCMEEAGPSVGLSYTWWLGIDENGTSLIRSYPWRLEGDLADALTALNFIGNASVPLIRKACFDRVGGYDPGFQALGTPGCEDWDLSLRIAEHYRLSLVPEHLAGYRRVRGSMSGDFATMVRSHELMLQRLRQRRPDVPDILQRWSRGQLYGYIAMTGARTGDYRGAVSWFTKGLRSKQVSYLSPWVFELMLSKMPTVVSRPSMKLVRRRARRRSDVALLPAALGR